MMKSKPIGACPDGFLDKKPPESALSYHTLGDLIFDPLANHLTPVCPVADWGDQ
jgi:hypothetical protein